MVEFICENWVLILVSMVIVIVGSSLLIREPKRVREWLIWACAQAEMSLGSGTGALKLRAVYDMFILKFPIFSKIVPFSVFQEWTEDALVAFKSWLEENATKQSLFDGDDNPPIED
jgi:hypothetical protein